MDSASEVAAWERQRALEATVAEEKLARNYARLLEYFPPGSDGYMQIGEKRRFHFTLERSSAHPFVFRVTSRDHKEVYALQHLFNIYNKDTVHGPKLSFVEILKVTYFSVRGPYQDMYLNAVLRNSPSVIIDEGRIHEAREEFWREITSSAPDVSPIRASEALPILSVHSVHTPPPIVRKQGAGGASEDMDARVSSLEERLAKLQEFIRSYKDWED